MNHVEQGAPPPFYSNVHLQFRAFTRAEERRPRISKRRGRSVEDAAGNGKASPGMKRNNARGLLRTPSRCEGRGKVLWPLSVARVWLHAMKYLMLESEVEANRKPVWFTLAVAETGVIYCTDSTNRYHTFFLSGVVELKSRQHQLSIPCCLGCPALHYYPLLVSYRRAQMMTMHQAKGREFKVVFLTGET